MDTNKRDHFVDQLLDSSLRHLHRDEPRAGLEGRILAGARAWEGIAQRRRFWTWALGGAASLAVVAVVVSWPRRHHLPVPVPTLSSAPLAATKPAAAPQILVGERSALPRAVPHLRDRPYRAPRVTLAEHRPMQFPTPMPLTKQEKLLLLYVKTVSQSGTVVGANPSRMDEDSGIPELSVAALDPIRPLSESEGRTEN